MMTSGRKIFRPAGFLAAAVAVGVCVGEGLFAGQTNRVVFVEDGRPKLVRAQAGDWKRGEGYLERGGPPSMLLAAMAVRDGDFRIRAKLTILKLDRSAASFTLGGSHFGFEGGHGRPFVEGPLFRQTGDKGFVKAGEAIVTDAKPFAFEVVRKGKDLTFLVDGQVVYRMKTRPGGLGPFGFRPWRSTMRITHFSAEGDLRMLGEEVDVFVSGQEGYHTFRIPSVIVTQKGTVLAFCEGRKGGRGDSGNIDLVLRRSTDGGKTWSKMSVVWDDAGNTCGNPCPVIDRETGTIWLPMTWNLGTDHEGAIMRKQSQDTRRVYVTRSTDDGLTWAKPTQITETTKKPHWRWYATGPGVGIQLRGGRMLIPCDTSIHDEPGVHPYRSHVIYSDDHGKTWRLGGVLGEKTNECQAVERTDGSVLLNMRSYHGKNRRAVATSKDGGLTWSKVMLDQALIEPVCQAGMIRYTDTPKYRKSRILFSNPAGKRRENMTIRLSYDGGRTWPVAQTLYAGPAAYSCLTVLPDMTIGCLYEKDGYRRIAFARFDLDWLTDGKDRLKPRK